MTDSVRSPSAYQQDPSHLASFPQLNPNPVLEVDLSGNVTYANPATCETLERLGLDTTPEESFLPPDLESILRDWDRTSPQSIRREIGIANRIFGETITLVPELGVARIYGYDITERKQAEQELRESEERFRAIVETSEEGIATHAPDGTITYVNQRMADLLGYSREELVGKSSLDFVDDEEKQRVIRARESVKERGSFNEERKLQRKDGSTLWTLSNLSPRRDAAGNFVGYLAMHTDITERKHAEEALRESEERFRTLANAIPQLAWIAHADGYIYWYNKRWYEYTGTTWEQMEGWGWQSVHDPQVLPSVLERWKRSIAMGEAFDMEFPLRGADGIFRPFLTRVLPLKDVAGCVVQWFGTNTDVSNRKRAEEALRQRTEELQTIMEVVPTAVFITRDADARTITGNRAARELVELPPKTNISKSAPEAERPTGWQEMRGGVPIAPEDLPMQQAARGREVRDYEMDLVFRDGTVKSVLANATPLRDEQGNPQGGIAVLIDMTERRRAAERIQKLNQDLEQRASELEVANDELERLATSLALDLRSPLVSLRGVAGVLAQDYASQLHPQGRKLFELIQANAEEMEGLAQGLLKLMQIARQTLRKQELDPAEIVRAAWAELAPRRTGHPAQLTLSSLPTCCADPLLLKQVWLNLLSNALQATRHQKEACIEIGAQQEGQRISYFVKDNGVGFDMSYAGTIFRAFQRYHRPEEWEGSGVGLAIVESIVRRHGGRVWAEGAVNVGATFYFEV